MRDGVRALARHIGLLALGAVACSGDPAPLVLISVDTLRADHMGLYGYARDTTPHLDRFFRSGTVYDNAMSTAPCTIPAVRQMLSGGYDVDPDRVPLAELLRERGYATAAIASQHQFDFETARDYARGFDLFDLQGPEEVDHHGMTTRTADQVSDRALAWLDAHARDGPFFLWLHYFDPHDPYAPPAEHRHFDRGNRSPRSGDRREALQRERPSPDTPWTLAGAIFDAEDAAHLVNLYDGEVHFADAQIGRVLARLEALGLDRKAVVALTSDHGEWLGEGDRWDHCMTLQEVELHVPLLVRARGGPVGGAREPMAASTVDLLPTLANLLDVPLPPGPYHGGDLRGADPDRRVLAFWQGVAAVRSAEWKLHWAGRPLGLFRLSRDPTETRNVLLRHAEQARRLEADLETARSLRERVASDWEETVRRLRSIGYVE